MRISSRSQFRKTDRKQSPPEPKGDWRFSFHLPTAIAVGVKPTKMPGAPGVRPGIEIKEQGLVEVTGSDKLAVLEAAALLLDRLAGSHELTVTATLTRGNEPGPTLNGPVRRGFRVSHEMVVTRGSAVVIAQPDDKPLIVASKTKRRCW